MFLRRVVSNLIENAMKYTYEGGSISVLVDRQPEHVAVKVIDDGCGIAGADLQHVFEKFYRGRPFAKMNNDVCIEEECPISNETSGTGLGLYIVRNLAEQIGAEISVASPADGGRGTRFTLLVPFSFGTSEALH